MVVQLEVVSVASVEMTPSVLVATDTQRLLFNVGDGTQRMCMEHRLRLAKLQHVFLTELRAATVGGLPGMILTVSDTGKAAMRLHGPDGMQRYVQAMRHVVYRPAFDLSANDIGAPSASPSDSPSVCFQEPELAVFAVPIQRATPIVGAKRKLQEATTDAGDQDHDQGHSHVHMCVSYILETPTQRGKFLIDKARELGVPKGPLFGQLHQGKDVTLADGRVVRSIDCVSPSLQGTACAIIACPSLAYLDALVASDRFHRYQQQGDPAVAPEMPLQVLFHLADATVLTNATYIAWVQRFGASVEHVLLNCPDCPAKSVFRASVKLQRELHAACPHAFPLYTFESRDAEKPFTRRCEMPFAATPVVLGESRLRYTLSPRTRCGFDAASCFDRIDCETAPSDAAVAIAAQDDHGRDGHHDDQDDDPLPAHLNARLTFLGTGSAIPSKYRNVTANLLQLPSPSSPATDGNGDASVHPEMTMHGILLDCGEGTLGQLYRFVNGDRATLCALLRDLRLVWISHNHADHHLGLLRLLSFRRQDAEVRDPLLVLGPLPLMHWLQEYAALDPTIADAFTFVDNAAFDEADPRMPDLVKSASTTRAWLDSTLQITDLECIPVKHTHLSSALVFTWQRTLKLAFSGDCRPSELFAAKARDAFLLLHEATLEDAMQAEAEAKKHSTTAEALRIGQQAKAKHLVLTHFSQRYPKMPTLDETQDCMCAMDLLSIRFADLGRQRAWMETCMQIVAAHEEDEDSEE